MWWIALSLGLLGSVHCLAMCGPLAIVWGRDADPPHQRWIHQLYIAIQYNLGRVVMYVMLGASLGAIGEMLFHSGIQQLLTILAAVTLILLFLVSQTVENLFWQSVLYRKFVKLLTKMQMDWQKHRVFRLPFFTGLLNGLVPCGLVYLALAAAFAHGASLQSGLFMAYFGLGTFPMMVTVMAVGQKLFGNSRLRLQRLFPYVQLLVALLLLYRAFAFDIPSILDIQLGLQKVEMCH